VWWRDSVLERKGFCIALGFFCNYIFSEKGGLSGVVSKKKESQGQEDTQKEKQFEDILLEKYAISKLIKHSPNASKKLQTT
jgi:hypothetical protein